MIRLTSFPLKPRSKYKNSSWLDIHSKQFYGVCHLSILGGNMLMILEPVLEYSMHWNKIREWQSGPEYPRKQYL
jgi:hypothetical protein